MDFLELKKRIFTELKKNRIYQSELVEHLKMSDTGYRQAFENKTLKLETLINISNFFDLPVCFFLENEDMRVFKPKSSNHEARILALEQQISDIMASQM